MGQRGPLPKPTALIKLANNPGHLSKGSLECEPQPEPVLPDCPPELHKSARAAWKYYSKRLFQNGLLTELDLEGLVDLCMSVQMRTEMWEIMQDSVHKFDNGKKIKGLKAYAANIKTSQQAMVYKMHMEAKRDIREMSKHLGLSPSTRSRMKINKPVEVEDGGIEDFIGE